MALLKLILSAVIGVSWAGLAVAQQPAVTAHPEAFGFSPDRLQALTRHYQGYVDRGELPGAVMLIARNDQVTYFQAIGFQDRVKKTPMKTDAIFRLASMTKPIVSVAAMELVE